MNRSSRYSILLYGMNAADWMYLTDLVQGEIRAVILRERLSKFEAARYFSFDRPLKISQPHGPNPAAKLNWAMAELLQRSLCWIEAAFLRLGCAMF